MPDLREILSTFSSHPVPSVVLLYGLLSIRPIRTGTRLSVPAVRSHSSPHHPATGPPSVSRRGGETRWEGRRLVRELALGKSSNTVGQNGR